MFLLNNTDGRVSPEAPRVQERARQAHSLCVPTIPKGGRPETRLCPAAVQQFLPGPGLHCVLQRQLSTTEGGDRRSAQFTIRTKEAPKRHFPK